MSRRSVIVIGYGYAGAVTALAAAEAGAEVTLLEKAARPGGISICSAGGLRIAADADAAFGYLRATCGGKTPEDVLRTLAEGMTGLTDRLRALAAPLGAVVDTRPSPANYPLPGADTFGFAYVEDIPGFDPATAFPHVRGARQGALLFRVLEAAVATEPRIAVRLAAPASRLLQAEGRVAGVALCSGERIEADAVVLTCGGFEADPEMQAQYWPGGPALSAAYAGNTGDGIRMAQAAGAALWHMWHWHGCYGYRLPDPSYPFGVRVKRLPDWQPDDAGRTRTDLPVMPWILVGQDGARFMNEYEPYVQDTGARPLAPYDPMRQRYPFNPAFLVTDTAGLAMYPLGKPTRNDTGARYDWSPDNGREVEAGLFRQAEDVAGLGAITGVPEAALAGTLEDWEAVCAAGDDPLGRPPSSLHRLRPPYWVAPVVPVVSNTQGGPVHDAHQRICDPFGTAIPGLYAAGECGSAFGHLYMSGGNLAECFIGGRIAGRRAAGKVP